MAPCIQRATNREKWGTKPEGDDHQHVGEALHGAYCSVGMKSWMLSCRVGFIHSLLCHAVASSGCSSSLLTPKDSHWLKPFSTHHHAFVERNQRTWMFATARNRHDLSEHWVWKDRFCHIVGYNDRKRFGKTTKIFKDLLVFKHEMV